MHGRDIWEALIGEYERARELHPKWPDDKVHATAIMVEEAGEAMRAANNLVHHGGDKEELRKELIQTGAMVLRCLTNI